MFIGRRDESRELTRALLAPGRQAVVFGERGVGKTSLLNIVTASLPKTPSRTLVRYTCSHADTYSDIIWKYLESTDQSGSTEVTKVTTERELGAKFNVTVAEGGATSRISEERQRRAVVSPGITPDSVVSRFFNEPAIFVIDEFDRITDITTKTLLAETIKIQADRNVPTKLILCGVGVTADSVIGAHPSTIRNLFSLHVPIMPDPDIHEVVSDGFKKLGLRSEPGLLELIVRAAHGLPYFAHLLGEELAMVATYSGARLIRVDDFFGVLERVVKNVSSAITYSFDQMFIPTFDDAIRRPELLGQVPSRNQPLIPVDIRRAIVMALALASDTDLDKIADNALLLMRSANEFVPHDYQQLDGADAMLAVQDAALQSDFIVPAGESPQFVDAFARGYTWLKAAERYGRAAVRELAAE